MPSIHPQSILFITLDSCRYDTFERAALPAMKQVGALHKVMAPGNFTFASHMAMFAGFTPGAPTVNVPFVNPKYGKIFRMGGFGGIAEPFVRLNGHNIIDGFNRAGYLTIGVGSAGWFDPKKETSKLLNQDFQHFYHPGNTFSLNKQLDWVFSQLASKSQPVFLFMNLGETHVPYYYENAPWEKKNLCVPFAADNDAAECARRQKACLEWVDGRLQSLLSDFQNANIVLTADHGDAWGEDGLWEHGIHHPKVLEVPLLLRLQDPLGELEIRHAS